MSFLKKLFGLGKSEEDENKEPKILEEEDFGDYKLVALKWMQNGEILLAGKIYKEIEGEMKEYFYIRSDRLHSEEQAAAASLAKAKQIIKENGDRIFMN